MPLLISSSLGTTQPYIPALLPDQIGKFAGLHMHFPSLAVLNDAVAVERTNILESNGFWTEDQVFTVVGEAELGVYRSWSVSAEHARTIRLKPGFSVILSNDTATVIATSGVPTTDTGSNGDLAIDFANNAYYIKSGSAWGSVQTIDTSISAVSSALTAHTNSTSLHLTSNQNTFLDGLTLPTLTSTEVNWLIGVTSPIQTQLNTLSTGVANSVTHASDTALHLTANQNTFLDSLDFGTETPAAKATALNSLSGHVASTSLHLTTYQNTFLDSIETAGTIAAADVLKLAGSAASSLLSGTTIAAVLSTMNGTGIARQKINVDGSVPFSANQSMGGNRLISVSNPVDEGDATNMAWVQSYVQERVEGLTWKQPVQVATTENITLNGSQTVDGVLINTVQRVLVRLQTSSAQNGIYDSNPSGAWTRSADTNSIEELNGAGVIVLQGTEHGDTAWIQAGDLSTLNTDAVLFISWPGSGSGSVDLDSGQGIQVTGSTISVRSGNGLTYVAPSSTLTLNVSSAFSLGTQLDLADTVTAGQYKIVTVDAKGRVVSGLNPTTLSGFGITDAQGLSAELTAVSQLSTVGFLSRTGSGAYATRSLSAVGSGISLSNGTGAGGNVVITLSSDSASTPSTLVYRDGSGNFSAGIITATLAGNASTATTAATATSATNLIGPGSIYSTVVSTSASNSVQVREANLGGAQGSAAGAAPRLGFQWSGLSSASLMLEAAGRLAVRNSTGTSYSDFAAANYYASGSISTSGNLDVSGTVKVGATSASTSPLEVNVGTNQNFVVFSQSGGTTISAITGSVTPLPTTLRVVGNGLNFSGDGSTDQAFLTSAGNFGIGISPVGPLHVNRANGVSYFESPGVSSVALQFRTNSIDRFRIGTPTGSSDLAFYVGGTAETVRFDATGNAGFGTTAPSNYSGYTALTINNTSGGVLDLKVSDVRVGTLFATAGEVRIGSMAAVPLNIYTNSAQIAQFDVSGNLGLGTVPTAKLDVVGSQINLRNVAAGSAILELAGNGNVVATGSLAVGQDGAGVSYLLNRSATPLIIGTSGVERIRVDASNTLIGIGRTATTYALEVNGDVQATNFRGTLVGNASTASTLQTARAINGVSFNGSADITITAAAGTLTGSTLAANVTASSLTSLGTLTSLTVGGAIATSGSISIAATGGVGGMVATAGNGTNSGYLTFIAPNGARQGYIGFSDTTSSTDTGTIPYVAGLHSFSGAITASGAITGSSFSGAGTGLTGTATSLSIGGNAATASSASSVAWTNVSGKPDISNWNSTDSINVTVGMLAWKNYGNNHIIFDASAGTAPNGAVINNSNSVAGWSPTYPVLMGWNGVTTYGLRVDTARIADSASSVAWTNVSGRPTAVSSFTNDSGYVPAAGTGASGTWGISISGNAATASSASSVAWTNVSGRPTVVSSFTNDSGYVPANGTGASGTWGISISGNAATATVLQTARAINGVSFNGSADITVADNTKLSLTGGTVVGATTFSGSQTTGIATSAGGLGGIELQGSASQAAFMAFHRPGNYATYFGLDTDNQFKVGGWSAGAVASVLLHSSNYNTYAPTLTGTGASGTWGISISGNAATASSVAWTNVSGRPTAVSSFTNDSGYVPANGTGASGTWGISISGNAATASSASSVAWTNVSGRPTTVSSFTNDSGYITIAAGSVSATADSLVRRNASGYIFNSYFNSTDNSATTGVTAVMVKVGDDYLRSGTAAAIAEFISGQTFNTGGNAATASSVAWTNVSGRPTTVSSFTNDSGYVPAAGTGASGTWGISISGNAATASSASSVAWTNVSGRPTVVSSFTNDSGYITTSALSNYLQRTVDTWHTSADGYNRFYFGSAGRTYYSSNNGHEFRNNAGSALFTIDNSGNAVAVGDITAFSDIRLKANLELISNPISKIQSLRGLTFDRIDVETGRRFTGLIAQEVQAVLPEAVVDVDGTLTVAYGNLAGLFVEAIKDQQSEIETLKQEVDELKKLVASLVK